MTVRETILSPELKAKEAALQADGEAEFAAKLAQSMDLPSTLSKEVDEQEHAQEKSEEEQEESEQDEQEEGQEESSEEEPAEESTEQEESEEEDLIPKSKVQKRFDELTREKAELEARLRKLEDSVKQTTPPEDPEMKKLEAMDETSLRQLKRSVRLEQIKNSTNEQALSQYMDLEDKIDKALATAPARFQTNQNNKLVEAVNETRTSMDGFEKVSQDIFKYADSIYSRSPELMGSVTGKQRAWQLAVEHFSALKQVSEGKSKRVELERQVNTLKKKISVDTNSRKLTTTEDSEAKLFKRAKFGTNKDKEAFIRKRMNTDSLISDEDLAQGRR